MKEIIVLTIISGLSFLFFIVMLILGLMKKNKLFKLTALLLFAFFICLITFTGFKFITKSYNKVVEIFKPRTGDEIYDALFGKRQTDCVKILNYQDQIIPKIDCAIWLHFETCPEELKRILSRNEFSTGEILTSGWDGVIPCGEMLEWFNPTLLGDRIMVYEYFSDDGRNIQTIWTNLDSTNVFVRDIFD